MYAHRDASLLAQCSSAPPSSPTLLSPFVPNKLCNLNVGAYTPHVLSIKPFHHNRPNLAGMQTHKWRNTLSLLDRTKDASPTIDTCLRTICGSETYVCACYAEEIDLDSV
ncbi:hypothetical protein LINPERHAP2_LOCUS9031 [Linum perenne]